MFVLNPGGQQPSPKIRTAGEDKPEPQGFAPRGACFHGNCWQALTRNKVALNGEERAFAGEEGGMNGGEEQGGRRLKRVVSPVSDWKPDSCRWKSAYAFRGMATTPLRPAESADHHYV